MTLCEWVRGGGERRLSLYHEKNWMSPEKRKETFRLLTFNNFIPNGAFWKIMRNNLFASCCLFIYSLRLKMFPLHTHSYLWSILSPVNIIQNLHVFGLRVEDRKAGEITRKHKVNMYTLYTCTHCTPYEKQSRSKSSRFHLKQTLAFIFHLPDKSPESSG